MTNTNSTLQKENTDKKPDVGMKPNDKQSNEAKDETNKDVVFLPKKEKLCNHCEEYVK